MASDDNDPRRDRNRSDENNPFIAFRRFADSQVSSLMNTLFTLPATIANHRNAHVAREQCLFGRADKEKCKELHELEEKANKMLAECRDMFRAGDIEGALAKGEDLFQLNYSADMLRKQIVENGRGSTLTSYVGDSSNYEESNNKNKLVEKVANEKGQQWGWSWDWGFPRPFDAEEHATSRHERCRRWRRRREESGLPATQAEEHNDAVNEGSPRRSSPLEDERWAQRHNFMYELNEVLLPMFYELARNDRTKIESEQEHAERHGFEAILGLKLAASESGVSRDALEDLVRSQSGLPLLPPEQLGQSDHLPIGIWARRFWDQNDRYFVERTDRNGYPKRVPWEGEETAEDPNYEYSHDHEDQHDEPPTPNSKQGGWSSGMPETELEAYERLLGPGSTARPVDQTEGRPSVLSTLTTTERTVAPDGTVTTKVVLKKRFADGREESSETVHTERGQEEMQRTEPSSGLLGAAAQRRAQEQPRTTSDNKKTGWFWSN